MSKFLVLMTLTFSVFASSQFNTLDSVEMIEITEKEDGSFEEKIISKRSYRKSTAKYLSDFFNNGRKRARGTSRNVENSISIQSVGEVIEIADKLVALGKDVYDLVQLGKPVINLDTTPISVLPMNADKTEPMKALDLSNWQEPKVKKYRLKVKNYLGFTTVDFRWKIIFNYGGQLGETGAYITGAFIKPEHVKVLYGYDLNVTYKLQSISNVGTQENPIAQAVIDLDYKFGSFAQQTVQSKSYLINGEGKIKSL